MNRKHVFWQALFTAIIIFGTGLLLGLWVENYRNQAIEIIAIESEINVLDTQILGDVSNIFNIQCSDYSEKIIEFADDIYLEAQELEKYESSSQLTDQLGILHKKYDLLRVILWKESINMKDKCGGFFHTVVYLYDYNDPDLETKAMQVAFSRYLDDLKARYGNEIILIPIAADVDLASVDLIKKNYGINGNLPVVIVNEEKVFDSLEELITLEDDLF